MRGSNKRAVSFISSALLPVVFSAFLNRADHPACLRCQQHLSLKYRRGHAAGPRTGDTWKPTRANIPWLLRKTESRESFFGAKRLGDSRLLPGWFSFRPRCRPSGALVRQVVFEKRRFKNPSYQRPIQRHNAGEAQESHRVDSGRYHSFDGKRIGAGWEKVKRLNKNAVFGPMAFSAAAGRYRAVSV